MSTVPRNQIDRSYSLSRQISGQALPTVSNVGGMSSADQAGAGAQRTEEPKSFAPKQPVKLNTPKEDPIKVSELKKCDGSDPEKPTLVAIKGTVFDVSGNKAYQPGGQYHVFAGKDPSRALAMSSLKEADCVSDWQDLEDKEKTVLSEWFTFFSKRYNVVGQVVDDDDEEA